MLSHRPGPPAVLVGLLLAMLILAALMGCETVIDVNVPEHERQLVAQGFFAPESLWAVRVSHTVGYTDPEPPELVDDATVEIWEGDRMLERLVRRDAGTYLAVGSRPTPGHAYTLRVEAPGFDPVEGTASLPTRPPVVAFEPVLVEGPPGNRRVVRLRLTLDDPPGEENYYTLAVLHLRGLVDTQAQTVTPLPPALFPFTSDDPAFETPFPNPLDPDAPTFIQALFRDADFDGERRVIVADIAYDAPSSTGGATVRRGFVVLFAALSEDLYRYAETAPEQALFGENPFAEPLRIHSNLSNGFGVFAGFWPRVFPVPPDTLLSTLP